MSNEWTAESQFLFLPCPASDKISFRAITQLNADITVLDDDYNKLSEHVAQGERDDHNQEYPNCKWVLIVSW